MLATGVCALVGQVLSAWALRWAPASVVSVFYNVNAVVSLIIGWVFWGEWPIAVALTGAIFIIAGCVAASRSADRLVRRVEPEP